MPERVTIVGDGGMATVCSILLTQGGHHVTLWGAFEESINRLIQNRENQLFLPGVRLPRASASPPTTPNVSRIAP